MRPPPAAEKGSTQGRKRGGEPAIEFAKGGECVFERAMKNPTPATKNKRTASYCPFVSANDTELFGPSQAREGLRGFATAETAGSA